MKKVILLVMLGAVLSGCEEFPVEGGGDDLAGGVHQPAHPRHAHGGLDDRLLNVDGDR